MNVRTEKLNNVEDNNINNGGIRGRRRVAVWLETFAKSRSAYGYECINFTRHYGEVEALFEKSIGKLTAGYEKFNTNRDYTTMCNDRIYSIGVAQETAIQRQTVYEGRRLWESQRRIDTANGVLIGYGSSNNKKLSSQYCNYAILSQLSENVKVQMDSEDTKESVQGLAIQESDKSSNTIVTRDAAQTESNKEADDLVISFVSSERPVRMRSITSRWMPLKAFKVDTSMKTGDSVVSYYLPETVYPQMCQAINLLPFEAMIYGNMDMVMKFVVNGHKFQCGKVVVSVKFDTYQADECQNTVYSALNRPHIMLDLSTNVEGQIKIPFRYHRAMVRNVKNDSNSKGVRPCKYATVNVFILSPLNVGTNTQTELNIRPFIKFSRTLFTGMSYRVPVQMDFTDDMLKLAIPNTEVIQVLKGAEKLLKTLGITGNRDKPTEMRRSILVPQPRLNFGTGKGLSDAVPLRMNPYALTTYQHIKPSNDEPKTVLDIARIWGLRKASKWKVGDKAGTNLVHIVVDPTTRDYSKGYTGNITPLEYVSNMYQFYSGTIEVRIDFISTAFHTGAVMLSAEFGRQDLSSSEHTGEPQCNSASTYTKTFHLGDQKTVTFTIPYIYDTVWRRNTILAYQPDLSELKVTDTIRNNAIAIRADSKTVFNVRVINELRAVQTVSQEIEMLVYWRASPNFMLHGLTQMNYVIDRGDTKLDNFPKDGYYKVENTEEGRRKAREAGREGYDEWATSVNAYSVKQRKNVTPTLANEWNEVRAKVQMDTGDKEAEDSTEDFNTGSFSLGVQTTDSQLSIKDILRRPTLLIHRLKIKGTETDGSNTQGFYIPLMPPSREFQYVEKNAESSIWSYMIGQTPQAALMNLFRFWRGSMRYTIIVENTEAEIVYVTHVPHSGTRMIGGRNIGGSISKTPIYATGLTTEVIVPIINPTAVVEVPYDTENNWTLTFEEDAERNYSWRDKGDTNSGHLVITTASDLLLTVFWSGGDDFEVANFYGIPKGHKNTHLYQWNDTNAPPVSVQMDFSDGESFNLRRTLNNCKVPLAAGLAYNIPIVGPTIAATIGATRIMNTVDNVTNTMDQVRDKMDETLETANSALEQWQSVGERLNMSLETIDTNIGNLVSGLMSTISVLPSVRQIVENLVLDVVTAWLSQSWVVVGTGIVRIINQIFGLGTTILNWGILIGNKISEMLSNQAVVQSDEETLIGLICGLVGSIMRITINPSPFMSIQQQIASVFTSTSGVSYLNQVIRFIQLTLGTVKTVFMRALGMVDPEVESLRMLSENSTLLKEFVSEAQICISEANTNLMLSPSFRTRFWKNTVRAYQIQKAIITLNPTNMAKPQLAKLCADVIKHATERFVDLSCSPVKYEPYVVCIEGESGIGKSYMAEMVGEAMLNEIGFNKPVSGIMYTRAPGSRFWSTFRDQPIVCYDDWINLNDGESITQQIAELYQMKSTTKFIPEMAHLEEKRIQANPLVVFLICNDAFPSALSNVAIHSSAVMRRRDLVIQARLKEEFKGKNLRELTVEESMNLAHLEFTIYLDSKDSSSRNTRYFSWNDFKPWFLQHYHRYHKQEQINVRRRTERLQTALQLQADDFLGDPFELFYTVQNDLSTITQNGWTPHEQLEEAVMALVNVVSNNIVRQEIDVPDEPPNIFTQVDSSLWSLVQTFARGLIMTPSMFTRIMAESWEGIMSLLPDQITNVLAIGHCAICMNDEVEIMARCQNSTAETPHYLCTQCYARMRALYNNVTCPLCRGVNIELSLTPTGNGLLGTLVWLKDKGRRYIQPLLNVLVEFARVLPTRLLAYLDLMAHTLALFSGGSFNAPFVVERAGMIVGDTIVESRDVYEDALEHPFLYSIYAVSEWGRHLPQVQMDIFDELPAIPPIVEEPQVQPHVFDPVEPLLELVPRTEKRLHPRCLHNEVLANVNSAHFRFNPETGVSEWEIAIRDNDQVIFAFVEDHPCCGECPVKDAERFLRFYIRWRTLNLHTLRRDLSTLYQGGEAARRVRQRIPTIYLPDWARNDIDTNIPEDWWNYINTIYSDHALLINVCIGAITAVGGLATISYLWNKFATVSRQQSVQADLNYNVESRNLRQVIRRTRTVPTRVNPSVQMEDITNVVIEYVVRNYVTVKVWENNQIKRQVSMVGICEKYAIMPKHYVRALENLSHLDMTIEIAMFDMGKNHLRQQFKLEPNQITEYSTTDLAVIRLPNSFPSFKDIRKFFQKEQDLNGYYPNEANIILVPTKKRRAIMIKDIALEGIQPQVNLADVDGSTFWAMDVLKYDHSENGACGSLVIVDRHQRPLRAMHVAGTSDNTGYGVLITQELLEDMLPKKIMLQYETTSLENIGERDDAMLFDFDCFVDYVGVVSNKEKPFLPRKSKIKKSVIHQKLPPAKTEPCILTQTDPRYELPHTPLYYGARKHGLISKNFSQSEVSRVREAVWDALLVSMKPCILNPKRFDYENAIKGIPGLDYYDPMRLDTSAGYPWQIKKSDTSKKAWINVVRNVKGEIESCEIDDDLLSELQRKETLRKEGTVPCTIFCDTLKDERKIKTKIRKAGGTRVFCASPIDYTIATRQNLLHFCAAFMKKRFGANHAVGINAKGPEWTELYNNLVKISPTNIITMDYSNFGPAFNAVVSEAAADLIIKWVMNNVEGCDETELRALLVECTNSVHIANSTVYRQFAGSPSGSAITTIINTLVNILYIYLAWFTLAGERAVAIHPDVFYVLQKHVYFAAYGDDFIMSVSNEFVDIFNANTLRNYFKEYGIVTTTSDKEKEVFADVVPITEATFLKRSFRAHPNRRGFVLGALDKEVVEEIPKWIWETADRNLATRVNVESALMEAHGHGQQYFNEKKEEWNIALSKFKIQTTSLAWDTLDEMWFKGTMPSIPEII